MAPALSIAVTVPETFSPVLLKAMYANSIAFVVAAVPGTGLLLTVILLLGSGDAVCAAAHCCGDDTLAGTRVSGGEFNRMVTSGAVSEDAGTSNFVPHEVQNRAASEFLAPHCVQYFM
jgi:hypothetical protein